VGSSRPPDRFSLGSVHRGRVLEKLTVAQEVREFRRFVFVCKNRTEHMWIKFCIEGLHQNLLDMFSFGSHLCNITPTLHEVQT
jgi:hypothetical protein